MQQNFLFFSWILDQVFLYIYIFYKKKAVFIKIYRYNIERRMNTESRIVVFLHSSFYSFPFSLTALFFSSFICDCLFSNFFRFNFASLPSLDFVVGEEVPVLFLSPPPPPPPVFIFANDFFIGASCSSTLNALLVNF